MCLNDGDEVVSLALVDINNDLVEIEPAKP